MLLKTILILSATILPLPTFGRVPVRGRRAYEDLSPTPSPAPVVANGHPTTMEFPRKPVVPVPELRLVSDVSDATVTRSSDGSDASEASKNKGASVLAFDRRRPASTGKFVRWLAENHSGADLSRTRLIGHYFEFCELTDRLPLRERQLLNAIKKHGVVATRPTAVFVNGKSHRPTVYKLRVPQRRAAA